MNHHEIAERNIERLLTAAYKPEEIDPEFAQSVEDYLCGMALELADKRSVPVHEPSADQVRYHKLRRRLGWVMAAAACVAILALVLYAESRVRSPYDLSIPGDGIGVGPGSYWKGESGPGLTARPRATQSAAKPMAVGTRLTTRSGERRRVVLDDSSVLYVNQDSDARLTASRQLLLTRGEVYLEVAPRAEGEGATFVVKTPGREVSALGTHFAVKAEPAGTGVIVTQGAVKVSGVERIITAGQEVKPGSTKVARAPRASHVLDWMKPLMSAAEAPLVPGSKYAGGALIAVDPNGQEISLALRKYHIDVHIEDGFARTTIDQTYFNTSWGRLEGTFYFPLPADAVLSRLAMYVEDNGQCKLMEGGMAEREHARNVFETIRHTQRDPALLEWVDGTTFKMRVFPLEGRKEKRVILSYTQRLPLLYGSTRYRFPGGHNMELVRDWSFRALVRGGANLNIAVEPNMHVTREAGDAVLSAEAHNVQPKHDVTLELSEKGTQLFSERTRFASMKHEGAEYLMVRFRPELKSQPRRQQRDWVILFESSANRNPLLARTQIDAIRYLLLNAEHDDTFAILTAGTRVRIFDKQAKPATPENIAAAVKFLESTHLIGGLDLAKSLDTAVPFLRSAKNPHLVHIGAGLAVLGEKRDSELAKRIPEGTRYIGIGVGKQWNRAFMKLASERTGGYFRQINPDEPIAWHGFDLIATLNTPRLMNVTVVDNEEKAVFLTETTALAQGEEVCAIARVERARNVNGVTVAGVLDGKPWRRVLKVTDIAPDAGYLPRAWAKLEIDRLVANGSDKNKAKIIELSKASYVMSPFTSLLVLETEADYQRFNVDRGRKDHWAMYACPERIPIVYEPDTANAPAQVKNEGKRTVQEVLQTVQVRVPPRFLYYPNRGNPQVGQTYTAWQIYTGAIAAPETTHWTNLGDLDDRINLHVAGNVRPLFPLVLRELGRRALEEAESVSRTMTTEREVNLELQQKLEGMERTTPYRVFGAFPQMNERFRGLLPAQGIAGSGTGMMGMGGGFGGGGFGGGFGFGSGFGGTNFGGGFDSGGLMSSFNGGMGMVGTINAPPMNLGWTGPQTWTATNGTLPQLAQRIQFAPAFVSPTMQWGSMGITVGEISSAPTDLYLGNFYSNSRVPLNESIPVPSLALLVRGGSRIHADFEGGLLGAKQKRVEARLDAERKGLWVANFEGDLFESVIASGQQSLLYERPIFTGDQRFFTDLTLYAPGLNTTTADIQTVLEAEAKPASIVPRGTIDPAATKLIDKARSAGWQTLTIPGENNRPDFKITFNGFGQYHHQRVLSSGLKEIVVCDGKTLLHLYPEIGLGAKRQVSRFHHVELARLVPWFLPPAQDLARGADVKLVKERTVALVPKLSGKEKKDRIAVHVHLVFAANGRLAERQLVRMPESKVLYREVYEPDGRVTWFTGTDKKPAGELKQIVKSSSAPGLEPDTRQLVLVPMPWRTADSVLVSPDLKNDFSTLSADHAVALMAANLWTNNGVSLQVFGERFHSRGDRRLGFYTLLAAVGASFAPQSSFQWNKTRVTLDVEAEHPKNPLAKYLAKEIHQNGNADFGSLSGRGGDFIQRLAAFHDLFNAWNQNRVNLASKDNRQTELGKLNRFFKSASPEVAWAVASIVATRVGNDSEFLVALLEGFKKLSTAPGLDYAGRYEEARAFLSKGETDKARQVFEKLYTETRARGALPLIDQSFRQAFPQGDAFAKLMRETAADFVKDHHYTGALALAIQLRQVGETALADELLNQVMDRAGTKHPALTLAAIQHLAQNGQLARGDALLQTMLKDEKLSQQPALWRYAATLAQQRGLVGRAAAALEKALDLEYPHLPPVVNLQAIRTDYGTLLNYYHQLVLAINAVETTPPKNLAEKVVRAADRWRALDPDATAACQLAARILQALDQRDLAWDYLTTPIALKPNESSPWLDLAHHLQNEDFELADRSFDLAYQAEPTNAQILWERAQHLTQHGHRGEARELYRKLAEGDWQPRFQWIKQQAQAMMAQ